MAHKTVFLLSLFLLTGNGLRAEDPEPVSKGRSVNALKTIEVKLGAQSSNFGNFLDLFSGVIYSKREAEHSGKHIQLMYVYGKNSKANLFFTGSSAIRKYARSAQEFVNQWSDRHEGQIINIGPREDLFDDLESAEEIGTLFHEKRNTLFQKPGYNVATQGPGDGLSQLKEGDILLVNAFNKHQYIAVHIVQLVPGVEGSITLTIKRPKSKAAVQASEPEIQGNGDWKVGQTYADALYWSEYTVGDMPLVISVPHGGNMNPLEIPDRSCLKAVRGTDRYTVELARAIQKVFYEKYHKRPHIIVSNLSRRKIDHNRNEAPATCGNETMKAAWQLYHRYIDTAIALAGGDRNRVFFVDLHAHGHKIQRLEVGYLINGAGLKEIFDGVNLQKHAGKSSLVNLFSESSDTRGAMLRDLFIGEQAFGTLMEHEGIRAIPSRQDPYPGAGEVYLNRGYNTLHFTSTTYPNVYGLQMECNLTGVRDIKSRPHFAEKFARIVLQYMQLHQ